MHIGILITARMGSTRLRDKHLRDVAGAPALAWLLGRIAHEFSAEVTSGSACVLIATGNQGRNAAFGSLAQGAGASVFHGDDDNVPLRHLQAAEALGLDGIVSVDGDDLFCAPEAMRCVYDALVGGASLARTSGLPLGMNAWGYDTVTLRAALSKASAGLLETGWGRIFEGIPAHETVFACPSAETVRATLDYPEDLVFFDRCVREIPGWATLSAADLVAAIGQRHLQQHNASLSSQYWENFRANVSAETSTADTAAPSVSVSGQPGPP